MARALRKHFVVVKYNTAATATRACRCRWTVPCVQKVETIVLVGAFLALDVSPYLSVLISMNLKSHCPSSSTTDGQII
jgi:hypothetical protein